MVVWSQLNALLTVARCRSITKAAEELGYTPSAVSQQVRKLEKELKHGLIDRHSRGVTVTEAGRIVADHAGRIDIQLSSMDSALEDLRNVRRGSLSMATFPTAGATIVGRAIAAFRETYPEIDIDLRSDLVESLVPMLLKRDVGLAVVWEYPAAPWDAVGIERIKLGEDRAALVLPKFHELARLEEAHISQLKNESWIVSRGAGRPTTELIARLAEGRGFKPRIVFEAGNYQEAHALVAAGLGVTLTPGLGLATVRDDVQVVPLIGDNCYREIFAAHHSGRELNPADHAMLSILREIAPAMLSAGSDFTKYA